MVTTTQTKSAVGQQGFTLVELAIVLVIVGLLIGGILKGQELIAATRVNSTVTQIKAIETATYTFLDTYGGMPGDLPNAATRINGCATAPCSAGTAAGATLGNSRIDGAPELAYQTNADAANTDEKAMYFNQLRAADLLSGFTGSADRIVGQGVMGSSLGSNNHYRIGYAAVTTDLDGSDPAAFSAGHYLVLAATATNTAISEAATGVLGLAPKQAEGIDRKMDDARPNVGRILAAKHAAYDATTCVDATAATGVYQTNVSSSVCSIYIGIAQ